MAIAIQSIEIKEYQIISLDQIFKIGQFFFRIISTICTKIGKIAWIRIKKEYLKKSSIFQLYVLISKIKMIPSSIVLLILFVNKEVEILVEYKDISRQCNDCLELEHETTTCIYLSYTYPHKPKKKFKIYCLSQDITKSKHNCLYNIIDLSKE